jgi:hypothetical protein
VKFVEPQHGLIVNKLGITKIDILNGMALWIVKRLKQEKENCEFLNGGVF